MAYKVIFLDIDYTIYDTKNGTFPASGIEALKKAQANGVKLVVASGRNLSLIHRMGLLDVLHFDGIITSNGTIIYDGDEQKIYQYYFDINEAYDFFSACDRLSIPYEIISDEIDYISMPLTPEVIEACDCYDTAYPTFHKYNSERFSQLLLFADEDEAKKLMSKYEGNFKLNRFHKYCLDVFAKGVNKGTAVAKYLQLLNIKPEEAIAFGDENNDLEMIEVVGMGVAMGNGTKEMKEIANYVTTDINDNGIKNALIHLGVIEEF